MSTKTIVSIIAVILGFVIGKLAYDYFFSESDTVSFDQGDWQSRSYLDFTFEAPFELTPADVDLPPAVKKFVSKTEMAKYDTRALSFIINRTEYIDGTPTDIDGAVRGAMANMKLANGVTDFEYESSTANRDSLEGRSMKGTFKLKGHDTEFNGRIYKLKTRLWVLICVNLVKEENRAARERVMKSVKLGS